LIAAEALKVTSAQMTMLKLLKMSKQAPLVLIRTLDYLVIFKWN